MPKTPPDSLLFSDLSFLGSPHESRSTDGSQRGPDRAGAGKRLDAATAVLPLRGLHHQVQPQHGRHIFAGERQSLVLDVSGHIRLSALFLP